MGPQAGQGEERVCESVSLSVSVCEWVSVCVRECVCVCGGGVCHGSPLGVLGVPSDLHLPEWISLLLSTQPGNGDYLAECKVAQSAGLLCLRCRKIQEKLLASKVPVSWQGHRVS